MEEPAVYPSPFPKLSRNILAQRDWISPCKPITLPLVNKDIFNRRPECIVKDGVWIQVQPRAEESLAMHDAMVEQKKIDKTILQKEERLKKFQRDVQRRVTIITRAQRQMVTKTQSDNIREEQDILYRSVAAAENATPRKNRCSYNVNQVTIDASGKLTAHYKHESPTKGATALMRQSTEIEKLHSKARQNLAKRQLVTSAETDNIHETNANCTLPGGFWGTSKSRDKSAVRLMSSEQTGQLAPSDKAAVEEECDEPHTITATSAPHDIAIAAVQEGIMSSPAIKSRLQKINVEVTPGLPSALEIDAIDEEPGASDKENQDGDLEFCPIPASSLAPSTVHFRSNVDGKWKRQEVVPCENQSPKKVAVTRMGETIQQETDGAIRAHSCGSRTERSAYNVPFVAPGAVEHERKKMDERNRLLCRRVFSDIERERVREERRRREHKSRVERLRAEKEAERIRKEKEHDDNVHKATEKLANAQLAKEAKERRKLKKKQDKIDKQTRAKRFVTALKVQIQERLEMNRIVLPPLCCCSSTFWGTDPDTCANNCIFYRNIDAYTAALQSVLTSVEQNAPSCKHERMQDHSVISLLSNE